MKNRNALILVVSCAAIAACGGSGGGQNTGGDNGASVVGLPVEPVVPDGPLDTELRQLITANNLTGDAANGRNLPSITDAKAQLGKQLFFTKNLGGQFDAACVSCHHPSLGGGDDLSLSVGVNPVDELNAAAPNLLGQGRFHSIVGGTPTVPRNAPTVFNIGLWDSGMFWDSRVSSIAANANANGIDSAIITPDSVDFSTADNSLRTGASLPEAQARFPVTSADEMRASFLSSDDNDTLRAALATRLDNEALWQQAFTTAFGDSAITYDRIGEAIGEYERSMVFTDTPWKAYVEGDNTALSDQQKEGAILFYTSVQDGGAGCSRCHSGDLFSDEEHHIVAFPQLGPGKGNDSGNGATADFGRENISGDIADRFHFRTPTLLNVAVTAPYGHAGGYQTLAQVLSHYNNPRGEINDLFGANNNTPFQQNADLCDLPQIADILQASGTNCEDLYPNAYDDSIDAVNRLNDNGVTSTLLPTPNINGGERADIAAFLQALTDPCVQDRDCLAPWIIDSGDVANFPDNLPLVATDRDGVEL